MPKQLKEHPQSKINQTLGVAKKLSGAGLKLFNQLNAAPTTTVTPSIHDRAAIVGVATELDLKTMHNQQDLQQILALYVPQVSQRMLGKHYGRVAQVAQKVSPVSIQDVTNYLSQRLSHCADKISTVEQVLEQAGAKNIEQLRDDISRSGRLSQALAEQNKWFAATQGAFAAVTGLVGVVVDIPAILILALRVIYQTGRAYGFELKQEEQNVVDHIFQQIRVDLLAEKQTLLLGVNAFSHVLQQNDLSQLQRLAGSNTNADWLKNLLQNEDGEVKWSWLNKIPQVSALSHFAPFVAASVGGAYNWRFIQDVGQKAQHVFSVARDYLNQHPELELSILDAYERAVAEVEKTAQTPIKAIEPVLAFNSVTAAAAKTEDVVQPSVTQTDESKLKALEPEVENTEETEQTVAAVKKPRAPNATKTPRKPRNTKPKI